MSYSTPKKLFSNDPPSGKSLLSNKIAAFLILFHFSSLILPVWAQNKDGFYDEYDMDLQYLPGGQRESEFDERYPTYTVPPKREYNYPVTPKKVRREFDPILSVPGGGTGNLQNLGNQGAGARPYGNRNQTFINPVTGEIDYESLQNSLQNQEQERERKEKEKKRFVEEETYKETRARRFQIIFFLTLPFAFALSAGVASGISGAAVSLKVIEAVAWEKTTAGAIFVAAGSVGLSSANAYQDLQNMDELKKKNGTDWYVEEEDMASEWEEEQEAPISLFSWLWGNPKHDTPNLRSPNSGKPESKQSSETQASGGILPKEKNPHLGHNHNKIN
jgi:hypothetical protein